MKKFFVLFIVCQLVAGLAGCKGDVRNDSGLSLIQTTNPSPANFDKHSGEEQNIIADIKREVEKFDEIYDMAILKGEKDVLVAYKVKHMKRFRMKKIEKELLDDLQKKFPAERFTVSSDFKIFLEAVRLQKDYKESGLSSEEGERRLQQIIKLTKELT